ncbi:Baculoviral IAP repeat-containing protein 7-B [Bulinus truncatus]|nr:Baculoviral IAP repeat-containing protein 7-B [Bulinus truncatus]
MVHTGKSPHYHTVGIRCQVPNCSIRADKPKHPQFKDCFTRLATFREWPLDHPISPFFIAEAGYFLSKEHHLCCFFCGDKILIFSENDDVYEEHARRAPQCAHILQVKGKEFIHLIQMKDKDADSTESHCSEVEQSVKVEELPGPPSGSSLPEQVKISSTRDEWTELEEGDQNVRVHSSHNAQPLAATATDSRPVQEPSQSATDTRLVQESSHSAMDTRLVQESSQSATDTRLLQEPSESTEAFVYSESASLHTLPPTDLVMSLLAEQQSQNNRGEDYRLANLVCRSLGITRRICATQDNTFDPTIIDVNPQEPSLQNTG